jgi:Major Facilitator Superfamily
MQDKLGQAAWRQVAIVSIAPWSWMICRWLFYIEGGITISVAICAMFILPDFPYNTRWFTSEERELAISRLAEDGHDNADELGKQTTMQGLRDAVSDWKVWFFAFATMFQILGQSFTGYFPTLCATLGYDATVTLLLCAPPWVFGGMIAFALTWLVNHFYRKVASHRDQVLWQEKKALPMLHGLQCTLHSCIHHINFYDGQGCALYFTVSGIAIRGASRLLYLDIYRFLMTQVVGGYLVLVGWISNTFAREPAKRAVAIALMNTLGQTGNVIGSSVTLSSISR